MKKYGQRRRAEHPTSCPFSIQSCFALLAILEICQCAPPAGVWDHNRERAYEQRRRHPKRHMPDVDARSQLWQLEASEMKSQVLRPSAEVKPCSTDHWYGYV
jgi:hypothetical protein